MNEILRAFGHNNIHFTRLPIFRWDGENVVQSYWTENGYFGTNVSVPSMESESDMITVSNSQYTVSINTNESYYRPYNIESMMYDNINTIMENVGDRNIVFQVDENMNIVRDQYGAIRATIID